MKSIFVPGVWLVGLTGFAAVPAGEPRGLGDVGIDQRLGHTIPHGLRFRDEEGEAVALDGLLRGKPVLLTLVFYECPMLCTEILNGVVYAAKDLPFRAGREFDIWTVSFDPSDTPARARTKKANYLARYGGEAELAASGWRFLTGDAEPIRLLTEAVGFRYRYDPATKTFAHAAAILVLTPEGKVSRYFYGIEYEPRDLRLGLVEASEGKIGSRIDQLLLYCYRYDPTTGKYGLVVMNVLKLLGALTVVLLGGFILVQFLRERRRGGPGSAGTGTAPPGEEVG